MPTDSPPLKDGDLLAAVDLGSNSFHMVVARYVLGQLRIVDRIKETVRLAEGLDGQGGLNPDVMPRALDCLARFGQRLHTIPPQRVRAIATNTVRQLAQPQAFLLPAETALGHGIEVVDIFLPDPIVNLFCTECRFPESNNRCFQFFRV